MKQQSLLGTARLATALTLAMWRTDRYRGPLLSLKGCKRIRQAENAADRPRVSGAVRAVSLVSERFANFQRKLFQFERLGNEVRIRIDRAAVDDRVAGESGCEQHLEAGAES